MLYLIDEYIAEFPNRQHDELLKFKDCDKYLHEMTLSEVNEIVSSWNPTTSQTAQRTKRKINQYLDWLHKKGQTISVNIMAAELPTKDVAPMYIYSTTVFLKYYYIVYKDIDRNGALDCSNAATKM